MAIYKVSLARKNNRLTLKNIRYSIVLQHTGRKGADGYTPIKGVDYFDGIDGTNGIDGETPYIQNDNWWIDGVNTGVKAVGIDGITQDISGLVPYTGGTMLGALNAADHEEGTKGQIVNVCYGTTDNAPDPSTMPEGTIYIKYIV